MRDWIAFSEFLRNIGIIVGGAVGIFLAWRRVIASNTQAEAQLRQSELSRRSHVTELFNRAVGQLTDDRLEVRLGAILTLGQICKDFRDLSDPVIQLLTTHLQQMKTNYSDVEPPADVAEIVRIISSMSRIARED